MWPDRSRLDLRVAMSSRKRQWGVGDGPRAFGTPPSSGLGGRPLIFPGSPISCPWGVGGISHGGAVDCPRPPVLQLREDAPRRRIYQRGGFPDLSDPASRAQALRDFNADILATTSQASEASRTATVHRLMAFWNLPLLPLSYFKLRALGASLKAGYYRLPSCIFTTLRCCMRERTTRLARLCHKR